MHLEALQLTCEDAVEDLPEAYEQQRETDDEDGMSNPFGKHYIFHLKADGFNLGEINPAAVKEQHAIDHAENRSNDAQVFARPLTQSVDEHIDTDMGRRLSRRKMRRTKRTRPTYAR